MLKKIIEEQKALREVLQQIKREQEIVFRVAFQIQYDILKLTRLIVSDMDKLLGDMPVYFEEELSEKLVANQVVIPAQNMPIVLLFLSRVQNLEEFWSESLRIFIRDLLLYSVKFKPKKFGIWV
jgi:hypothetical protein